MRTGPSSPVVVAVLAAVLVPAYFLLPRLPFVEPPLGGENNGITGVPARAGEPVTLGAFICAAHSSPTLTGATVGSRGPLEVTATLVHSFDAEDPASGTYALGTKSGTAPDFEDGPPDRVLGPLGGRVTEVPGTVVDNGCDDPDDITQIVVSAVPDRDDVPSRIYEISVDYDAWGRSWTQDIALDWRWRAQR